MKLTREQILNLSGQSLVEAVAEKVMGWETPRHFPGKTWNPLTSENHLAEVREKMIERGYWYYAGAGKKYGRLRKDEVEIYVSFKKDDHSNIAEFKGSDYPTTLLRAALLAVSEVE